MATGEQIKNLIKAHFDSQPELFSTVALQLAAHEARQGHQSLAFEIRNIIDNAKITNLKCSTISSELEPLISISSPDTHLESLVVCEEINKRIRKILLEYRQKNKLAQHGLKHRRKILLAGPPGSGKTMTASILANELNLPLFSVMIDKIVTKYMGESSAKLRQIFDFIQERNGVFLFDEFDAIGGERGIENEVAEMRRVLNSFLQFIEKDTSDSLIIAATNTPQILDYALFRRFDDVIYYNLPQHDEIYNLIMNRLAQYSGTNFEIKKVVSLAEGLSHAEIVQACDNTIKDTILENKLCIDIKILEQMIQERKNVYFGKNRRRG